MDVPLEFEPYIPHHQTLFLNLKRTHPEALTGSGHHFGWVLRVIQKEEATREELTAALLAAIDDLETLSPEEAGTWEKLVYYLILLIYHRRDPSEHDVLMEQVKGRVRAHFRKEEVATMRQTIAQALIQEGRELGVQEGRELGFTEATIQTKQGVLMMLLRTRFGALPPNTVQRIQSISEIDRLDTLLNRFVTATSLEGIGIE
jgi:hypothetical protein